MPVTFKGISEYDRNFKWRSYDAALIPMSRWAGLPSAELGVTKEPNFSSKRRVSYYNPQIAKTFNWKENNGLAAESANLVQNGKKHFTVQEKVQTPDAPRVQKKSRSRSAVPRMMSDSSSSAAPRIQSVDEIPAVPTMLPENVRAPENKEVDKSKKPQDPSEASQQKDTNGLDRVLQKKAGLNVAPSDHPLKISEYRRRFERVSPTVNSPLLAAEQIIHNTNQSVPPFKTIKAQTDTEYKSQYKGSPPAKGPKLRKTWEDKHILQYDQEPHFPKRKDKRKDVSIPETGPAYMDTSEKEQIVNRKILKEKFLQQLRTPKFYRKAKTEYSANFLSPSEYKYKDGAWVRAKNQVDGQVKELREKAEYYRRRAQGTHFSREHLNQIISNNNRLWDVSTVSCSEEDLSRNIKALDLAGLQTASRKENLQQSPVNVNMPVNTGNLGVSDASTLPVRRKLVWDECDDDAESTENIEPLQIEDDPDEMEERVHEEKENPTAQHLENNNGTRAQRTDATHCPSEKQSDVSSVSVVEGRLPTPKLKTYGLAQRTHHDRTTPSSGGALLVSPSKHHENSEFKLKKSPQNDCSPNKIVSNSLHERKSKKNEEDQSVNSPPVAGLKTVDPLPLRKDPWPSPNISSKTSPAAILYPVNKPVEKPLALPAQQCNPSCRIHGSLRDPEFQHNGNFNNFSFYNAALHENNSIEDDRLSQISARSASSSSLASQVLQRAQKREYFWGKK